jgi:hypothetical protein
MASVSGQNNWYTVLLHNRERNCPLKNIKVHTDRTKLEENYIELGLYKKCHKSDALERVSKFVHERLENLGAKLETVYTPYYADEPHVWIASYVNVGDYKKARAVIDYLFRNRKISALDRSVIEDPLRELEKSGQLASEQKEEITVAQKDCMLTMIEPYVEEIKKEKPNKDTATQWIQIAAYAWKTAGRVVTPKNLPCFLHTASCDSGLHKSDLFYESLLALAKIYCSMADLESTLKQLGPTLPSAAIIQKIILDAFNESPATSTSSTTEGGVKPAT